MEKKEQESFGIVIEKEDKILNNWKSQLDETREIGQNSISNVCNFALKSVMGAKYELTDI